MIDQIIEYTKSFVVQKGLVISAFDSSMRSLYVHLNEMSER